VINLVGLFRFEGNGSLKDRLLTALIILVVALAFSWLAIVLPNGGVLCVLWATSVAVLSAFEVARLCARDQETLRYQPLRGVILFFILSLPAFVTMSAGVKAVFTCEVDWTRCYAGTMVAALLLVLYQVVHGRSQVELAARDGERPISAFLLVSLCAPQLILLSAHPNGVRLVWWLMAVVALNDSAAFFAGRSFGRHKMAPALSPNKTVEGSLVGLLVGALAGLVFFRYLLALPLAPGWVLLLSLLASIGAQAADLSKSYLKRLCGVKDTGAFFPGHGGVLDRFDGIIGAAPVVLLAFLLLGWI
jgi:CDP-diglyceride synthetase